MALIFKKEIKTATFVNRMSSIKSMFKAAYDNASTLKSEMETEINNKQAKIESLNKEIEDINTTKKEAESFMSNLEKFI